MRQRGARLITATKNKTDHTKTNRTNVTRKQKWAEKQIYGRFKRLKGDISHEKTLTWLQKGNLKRETESLLIAAQNNTIRTNHIKGKIDKTQQNSKCRLCNDRDETINHTIRSIRLDTSRWARWSTENCVRNWNLTIRTNVISTTHNLYWRMKRTNSSGILIYKLITKSQPDDQTL